MFWYVGVEARPRFFSKLAGRALALNVPDDLAVDGAGDTVLQLEVHLGNSVFWEYGGI